MSSSHFLSFLGDVKCWTAIGPAQACAQPIGLFLLVFCPVIGERLCVRLSDWSLRGARATQLVAGNVKYADFLSLYGECWFFNTGHIVGAVHWAIWINPECRFWASVPTRVRGEVFYVFVLFAGASTGPSCERIVLERRGTQTGGETLGAADICDLDLRSCLESREVVAFIRPQGINSEGDKKKLDRDVFHSLWRRHTHVFELNHGGHCQVWFQCHCWWRAKF